MGEGTSAASTYVGMTRGRHDNVAHLVAETPEQARSLWEGACSRDRADLGVAHARLQAIDDIDRYGPVAPARARAKEQVKRRRKDDQRREFEPWHTTGPGSSRRPARSGPSMGF